MLAVDGCGGYHRFAVVVGASGAPSGQLSMSEVQNGIVAQDGSRALYKPVLCASTP
jgi:hypothetical protein